MVYQLEMNLHATYRDKYGSELQGSDERRKRHGASEDQMAHQPSGEKVRLHFVNYSEKGGKDWWRSRGESTFFVFR